MKRPIVTLHLPLDMGAAGRILSLIALEYPSAVVQGGADDLGEPVMVVWADPDAPTYPSNADVDHVPDHTLFR